MRKIARLEDIRSSLRDCSYPAHKQCPVTRSIAICGPLSEQLSGLHAYGTVRNVACWVQGSSAIASRIVSSVVSCPLSMSLR